MSLCHGPGCRREQTVPFWCSERCREAWDAQHAGVEPPKRAAGGVFEAARERILAAIEDGCSLCPPGEDVPITVAIEGNVARRNASTMAEAINRAAELVAEMTLAGIPIESVDTESTPFLRAVGGGIQFTAPPSGKVTVSAAYPQVASEDPQVTRGWLGRLLDRFGRGETE